MEKRIKTCSYYKYNIFIRNNILLEQVMILKKNFILKIQNNYYIIFIK